MALIVLLVFFVLLWVLFILPQQRRVKAQEAFVAALQVGDEVITAGGIHGTIVELVEGSVRLEVADGVVLTMARGAIVRSQHEVTDTPTPSDDAEDSAVAAVATDDPPPPEVIEAGETGAPVDADDDR